TASRSLQRGHVVSHVDGRRMTFRLHNNRVLLQRGHVVSHVDGTSWCRCPTSDGSLQRGHVVSHVDGQGAVALQGGRGRASTRPRGFPRGWRDGRWGRPLCNRRGFNAATWFPTWMGESGWCARAG